MSCQVFDFAKSMMRFIHFMPSIALLGLPTVWGCSGHEQRATTVVVASDEYVLPSLAARPEALYWAAVKGDMVAIASLVKEGTSPNWFDLNGSTALMRAAEDGRIDVVRALLAAGADREMHETAKFRSVSSAAAEHMSERPWKGTALMYATFENHLEVVRELVHAGANIDAQDAYGRTPLFEASRIPDRACMDILLAAKADITHQDYGGHSVISECNPSYIGEFVKLGVNINARCKDGDTALHEAIYFGLHGDYKRVEALIAAGADVKARDSTGRHPLEICRHLGDRDSRISQALARSVSR